MTPKRRAAINLSWFFICLCFSKSLLIEVPINQDFFVLTVFHLAETINQMKDFQLDRR